MAWMAAVAPWVAKIAPYAAMAGSVMSATGQISEGKNAEMLANYNARQLERQANDERAVAQRQAIEEKRKAQLAQSRVQALAASSGGSTSDKSVVDIMDGLEQEGGYRALVALYEGEGAANRLTAQAAAQRFQGRASRQAGYMGAGTTLMNSGTSLLKRYG